MGFVNQSKKGINHINFPFLHIKLFKHKLMRSTNEVLKVRLSVFVMCNRDSQAFLTKLQSNFKNT